ncbi:MAG TPA: hypothetical protein V6D50_14180 [Chroococcales cyanobacterium]
MLALTQVRDFVGLQNAIAQEYFCFWRRTIEMSDRPYSTLGSAMTGQWT